MNLGFGASGDTLVDRLPVRFLVSKTGASGIHVDDFLKVHPEIGGYYGMDSDFGESVQGEVLSSTAFHTYIHIYIVV